MVMLTYPVTDSGALIRNIERWTFIIDAIFLLYIIVAYPRCDQWVVVIVGITDA